MEFDLFERVKGHLCLKYKICIQWFKNKQGWMREGAGEIDHKFKKGSSQIAFKDTNLHSIDLLADLYLFLMAYGTNVPLFSHNTGVKIRVYNLSE